MDLAKLKQVTTPESVEYLGQVLNFSFYPARFTPRLEDAANEAEEGQAASLPFRQMLITLLAKWDLKDDGKDVPLDAEAIAEVPSPLLVAVSRKIAEASRPNETSSDS